AGGGIPGRSAGGPDRPGHLLPGARRARQDGPYHRDQHRGGVSGALPHLLLRGGCPAADVLILCGHHDPKSGAAGGDRLPGGEPGGAGL
ncbi:DUF1490 domain-containing protein, partial [Dysosmobacter welbionis]